MTTRRQFIGMVGAAAAAPVAAPAAQHSDAELLDLWQAFLASDRAECAASAALDEAQTAAWAEQETIERPWRAFGIVEPSKADPGPWQVTEYRCADLNAPAEWREQPYPEITDPVPAWPARCQPMTQVLAIAYARERRDLRRYDAERERIAQGHNVPALLIEAKAAFGVVIAIEQAIHDAPTQGPLGRLVKLSVWRWRHDHEDETLMADSTSAECLASYEALAAAVGRDLVAEARGDGA